MLCALMVQNRRISTVKTESDFKEELIMKDYRKLIAKTVVAAANDLISITHWTG